MKFPRRKFLHLAAGAAAAQTLSHVARAQAYPTRPIRLLIPFPPRRLIRCDWPSVGGQDEGSTGHCGR